MSFTEGKLSVLGTAADRNLGGRDFDELLVRHFTEMIKTKYKMDPTTEVKAMQKLRKEVRKKTREKSAWHLASDHFFRWAVSSFLVSLSLCVCVHRRSAPA